MTGIEYAAGFGRTTGKVLNPGGSVFGVSVGAGGIGIGKAGGKS